MRKKTPSRIAQAVIGLIIGLMLAQPVAAQIGSVHINSDTSVTSMKKLIEATKQSWHQLELVRTSHVSFWAQLAEYAEVADRWVETVNHYTNVIIQDVKRFTSLKGIMGFIEQELGLDDDTLKALADIGRAVRGIMSLKNHFMSMVHTRLSMLRDLEQRARNGIFDPRADLADLEEYLRTSIGRSAQNVIATRERLAQFDNELERWTFDLGMMRAKRATLEEELKQTVEQLRVEGSKQTRPRQVGASEGGAPVVMHGDGTRVSASADAINNLTQRKLTIEGQIVEVDKQISDLITKITERYKRYHQKFDESKITADNWHKTQEGWERFMQIKDDVIEQTIDNYGSQQPLVP